MGKVRLCVFLLVLFVQHQTTSAKPSFWSSLFEMFNESCDSSDLDDMLDDSSDSDEDSKSDSLSSSDAKPIFNLTLPPSKNGLSVVVEKLNGQVAVNVNSLSGGSGSGDAAEASTAAATTAAAAATTAGPTTTAKA